MKREDFESVMRALAPVFAADREAAAAREAALAGRIAELVEANAGLAVRMSAMQDVIGTLAGDVAGLNAGVRDACGVATAASGAAGAAHFAADAAGSVAAAAAAAAADAAGQAAAAQTAADAAGAAVVEAGTAAKAAHAAAAEAARGAQEAREVSGSALSDVASLRADLAAVAAGLPEVAGEAARAAAGAAAAEAAVEAARAGQVAAEEAARGAAGEAARAVEAARVAEALSASAVEAARVAGAEEAARAVLALPRPRDGRDGRDGYMREPVMWEPGRRHAYGSVVRHRGGAWYAHRDTDAEPGGDGETGWSALSVGVSGVELSRGTDSREIVVRVLLSDGEVAEFRTFIPVVVYRGVYADGVDYREGDMVTVKGSTWIARVDEPRSRPGTNEGADEWTLAAKRGADGRDGAQGTSWTYRGWHEAGRRYVAGSVVRMPAGIWVAMRDTDTAPPDANGVPSLDWQPILWGL